MSEPVTVTERAAKRIAEIVAGEAAAKALRISVEGGGCSGFQYRFDLVPEAADDDVVLERSGARVVIDQVSLGYLAGSAAYVALPVTVALIATRPSRADARDMLWPASPDRRLAAAAFWATLAVPILFALAAGFKLTSLWTMPAWTL